MGICHSCVTVNEENNLGLERERKDGKLEDNSIVIEKMLAFQNVKNNENTEFIPISKVINEYVTNDVEIDNKDSTRTEDRMKENEISQMTLEEEIQYNEFSFLAFKKLNMIRTEPEELSIDFNKISKTSIIILGLGHVFKVLVDLNPKPDYILWSQRLYDLIFEKIAHLNKKQVKSTTEEYLNYMKEWLCEYVKNDTNYAFYSTSLSAVSSISKNFQALFDLLYYNTMKARSVLLDHFDTGCIVTYPISLTEDRVFLVLIQKQSL